MPNISTDKKVLYFTCCDFLRFELIEFDDVTMNNYNLFPRKKFQFFSHSYNSKIKVHDALLTVHFLVTIL